MPPLTIAILATLMQMHGPGTTIASDNKGVDDLLADVRKELEVANSNELIQVASKRSASHAKNLPGGGYAKSSEYHQTHPYNQAHPPVLVPPYGKHY